MRLETFDHRLLQTPHDLLAAVWRFRMARTHPVLPFEEPEAWRRTTEDAWLGWLSDEIGRWRYINPFLIRATASALAIEMPEDYEADSLSLQLLDIYRDVPWMSNLRKRYERP
jgi:hypothetical protein